MTSVFNAPPEPFKVDVPKEEIEELRKRLENARWPLVDTVVDDQTEEDRNRNFGMGYGELDRSDYGQERG